MTGYGGGSAHSSSGGGYGRAAPSSAPSSGHRGGGVLGGVAHFVEHLGSDIKNTALGLPAGLVQTAEHPLRSIETMGKSTWHDWSPLFHGHPGLWAHNFMAHPLAPLLDIGAVVGLAAAPLAGGAAASLDVADASYQQASIAGKIGQAARATELKMPKTSEGITSVVKPLRRSPVASLRQVALHQLTNKVHGMMPEWAPARGYIAPEARAERVLARSHPHRSQALQQTIDTAVNEHHKVEQVFANQDVAAHAYGATVVNALTKLGYKGVRDKILNFNHDNFVHYAHRLDGASKLPGGWAFVKDLQGKPLVSTAHDAQSFAEELHKRVAGDMTTQSKKLAMKDEKGNFLIVPKAVERAQATEARGAVHAIWKMTTQPWKMLQVGYAPRMVVNTAVGNVGMTFLEHRPLAFVHGVIDALRQSGDKKVLGAWANHTLGRDAAHGWYDTNFQDVVHSPSQLSDEFQRGQGIRGRLKSGLYPLVHKQEQFLKKVSVIASLRESPEVKAAMKDGMSFDQAAAKVTKTNTGLRNNIAKRALDTVGDYRTIGKAEGAARDIMPFYSWDKHITMHTLSLIDNHPVKLAALGAAGQQGHAEMQKLLGNLPSYAQGLLPLSALGIGKGGIDIPGVGHIGASGNGVTGVLSTRGLNPYASAADLAGMAQALVAGGTVNPSEDITSGINPLITHAVERLAGKRLGTQVPVSTKGSFIGGVLKDTYESVPEVRLPKTLIEGTPKPKPNKRTGKTTPFLYSKDAKTQVAALLGVPVKQMNVSRAHALAEQERTGKKPRSRRHSGGAGLYG